MPRVLVIDDNPSVATALEVLFSLHDIETVGAASPEEGLALLDRVPEMRITGAAPANQPGTRRSERTAGDPDAIGPDAGKPE